MALTNNNDIAEKMLRLRVHGITSKKSLMKLRPKKKFGIINK